MKRLALIAAAGLVLVGCAGSHSSSPAPPTTSPGPHYPVIVRSPIVEAKPPGLQLRGRVQLVSPTRLAIVTMGSSSCPSVPDELVVLGRHAVQVHLTVGSWVDGQPVAKSPGGCTLDYGPTPMLVAIDPELVDVHDPLTVRFVYRDSTKPEVWTAAPLKRYPVVVRSPLVIPVTPAQRDRFHLHGFAQFVSSTRLAIVTWGSGSCPHVPKKLVIQSAHSIELELAQGSWAHGRLVAHLPPNGICTTDLRTTPMLLPIDPTLVDVHHRLTIVGLQPRPVTVEPLKS